MECNKEEAIRAMDIAKRKVAENDYNGAKAFAIKAQNLYPQLDGLKQVLMLIDVYISAGNKISGGESDWYGILGVDPLADDGVVKKQFKKLALLLHPDKNKCQGAEGAFKLILEAWSLLSDKVKRIAFDQKRTSTKEVKPRKSRKQKQPPKQPKQPTNQQKQPAKQPNQQPNQQKQPASQPKQPPNQPKQPPNQQQQQPSPPKQPPNQKQPPSPQKQQPNKPNANGSRNGRARSSKPTVKVSTFYTMCNKCGTQHEYVRVYFLNKIVLCRNCLGSFKATEKEKTPTEKEKTPQATNEDTHGASCGGDFLSRMASSNSGNVANQPEERVKRVVEEFEEKDDEAARGIANSDLNIGERLLKKLRTDGCAGESSGIKV